MQRVLDEQRRTQRLGRPHAGNAQLADAARTALAGRRLDDVRDLHAQRAHAAQTQVQPVPPVAHGELAPVDRHAVHATLTVAVGHEVDVVDVARRREAHVEMVAIGGQRAVGQPRRRRVAVERREGTALGELGEARREVGADRRHTAAHERNGLRVGPASRERVELRGVLGELLARGHGPAGVAAQARGDEDAPAVGVADDERRAARGLRAQRRLVEVGGVVQRAVGPQRAEGGEVGDRRRRAVDHGRVIARQHAHHAAGRRVPAPDLREPRGGLERPGRARDGPRRPIAAGGGAERPQDRGRRGGGHRAAARAVVVGPLHDGADAHQVEQRPQLPGHGALLADQRIGRPLQVDGAQVGEGHDEARRHGPVGQGREDRVVGAAPVVEGEELAGQDHGALAGRQRAVEIVGGVAPRRGHAVGQPELTIEADPARERPARDRHQRRRADERGGPQARAQCVHRERAQAREAERHERPRLVRRAQEADGLRVVVGEGRGAAQRRPLGEADEHHQQAEEDEGEEERRVARAPRPGERPQAQCRDGQRRQHDGDEPQVDAGVGLEGAQSPRVTDADVARPEAKQPQRLGQRRGAPDRPRLLGVGQEVQAVAGVDEDGGDPPQAGERRHRHEPHHEPARRGRRHRAPAELVDHQQRGAEQQPGGDGDVDPAAGRRQHEREGRRPPPAAGVAQSPVHAQQQPRQRRRGQQRDRRPPHVGDDVRVEHVQQPAGQVAGAARAPGECVEQAHHPPRAERQHRADPQPPDDPVGQADEVAEGEERPHRPQVAAVLPGEDVAQRAARRPRAEHVAQERARRHVQVDLRLGHLEAGALHEGDDERQRAQREWDEGVAPGPPHGAGRLASRHD